MILFKILFISILQIFYSLQNYITDKNSAIILQYSSFFLNHLTKIDIKRIADKLNNRPRKALILNL